MRKFEVKHYAFTWDNKLDVTHIDTTVVYADTMYVTDGNTLIFYKKAPELFEIVRAWHDDCWITAYEIEDEKHEITLNNAELYAKAGLI